MARINTAVLIAQAAIVADRANLVRQDPAVVKAAKQALADSRRLGARPALSSRRPTPHGGAQIGETAKHTATTYV